jgi:hypothetical protein
VTIYLLLPPAPAANKWPAHPRVLRLQYVLPFLTKLGSSVTNHMPDVPVCGILDFLEFLRDTITISTVTSRGAGRNDSPAGSGSVRVGLQSQKPGLPSCRGMTRTAGQCTRGNTSTPQGHFRQGAAHKTPPVHTLALPRLLAFPCFFLVSRAGGEAATASTRGHAHRDAARRHSSDDSEASEHAARSASQSQPPSPPARALFLPLLRPACRRFARRPRSGEFCGLLGCSSGF